MSGLGNSASYQVSGIPFVKQVAAASTETINFQYVTKAITISSDGAGTTIAFGDADANKKLTLIANELYYFEIKCTKIIVTTGSGVTASVVAELTGIRESYLPQTNQNNYQYIYGCTDESASNYDSNANANDGSCAYSYTLGADPDVLFRMSDATESCTTGIALDTVTVTNNVSETFTSATFATTGTNPFNGTGGFATFDGTQFLQIEGPDVGGTCNSSSGVLCLPGEFTIDFWVKLDDVSVTNAIIFGGDGAFTQAADGNQAALIAINGATGSAIVHVGLPSNPVGIQLSIPDITNDTWYHIAFTRDSNNDLRGFIDGVQKNWNTGAGVANNTDIWNFDGSYIGPGITAYSLNHLAGAIDEFRITKGTAIDFATKGKPIKPYTCS